MKTISINVYKFVRTICFFLFFVGLTTHSLFAAVLPVNNTNITNQNANSTYLEVGLSMHRSFPNKVRGVNVNYKKLTPSVVEMLSKWNVNVIRINIGTKVKKLDDINKINPLIDYSDALERIDSVLPLCQKYGIGVIISLAQVPGREVERFLE